jgi:hypothetical protein
MRLGARGLLAAVAEQAGNFLLEPVDEPEVDQALPKPPPLPAPARPRPVIAVFGLARRCGATTVSRALAAELAGRDPAGTAAVASAGMSGGIPLATSAAARLADSLRDVPGATTAAVGRLCLVHGADHGSLADTARHFAPVVLDLGGAEISDPATSLADQAVLVTSQGIEPALATVAAECVRRAGKDPVVALNRGKAQEGPDDPQTVVLPESRMGAQLALGGRQPRGDLGRAVSALADRCRGVG